MRAVSHIAIGVNDLDKSLPFWTEVVGLRVSLDTEEEWKVGEELYRRRGVYLRDKDGPEEMFVVLDQQISHEPFGAPKKLFETGINHIGFWVDDLDSIADRARAADVPFALEPKDHDTVAYGEPSGNLVRNMIIVDPEGNLIQFEQRL